MPQLVELSHAGGWKELHDLRWAAHARNVLLLLQTAFLVAIWWRLELIAQQMSTQPEPAAPSVISPIKTVDSPSVPPTE